MYDHYRSLYIESTCNILTCTFEEFEEKYNDASLDTDVLCDNLLHNTIRKYRVELVAACDEYHLDKLLEGMLDYAPTPSGRRYVAIALHIAHRKGAEAVVNVAQAWLQDLFLMMWTLSRASKVAPSGSQTPTIDDTLIHIHKAARADEADIREKLRAREGFRCAITRSFDTKRAEELLDQGKRNEVPHAPQSRLKVAHIIPFLLNNFKDKQSSTMARTWDMLRSWTSLDISRLVGWNINMPANAILMTTTEHEAFGRFRFYFDGDAFPNDPNKYKVRMSKDGRFLSNGQQEADVEFPSLEASGIDPPDPEFLRIHAAFAKVLHLCGAADVMDRLERDAERGIPHPKDDFAQDVSRRLAILKM